MNLGQFRAIERGSHWSPGLGRSGRLWAVALACGALLCAHGASAQAASTRDVTVRWQAPVNAAAAQVSGYRLYRTPEGGTEERIEVPLGESLTLSFLRTTGYRLTLTAVGPGGESPRSNEIVLLPGPEAPRKFEIVIPASGAATIREVVP